jgi:hypothetical protein
MVSQLHILTCISLVDNLDRIKTVFGKSSQSSQGFLWFQCAQVTVLVANSWGDNEGSEFPNSAVLQHYLGVLEKYQRESGDGKVCITDLWVLHIYGPLSIQFNLLLVNMGMNCGESDKFVGDFYIKSIRLAYSATCSVLARKDRKEDTSGCFKDVLTYSMSGIRCHASQGTPHSALCIPQACRGWSSRQNTTLNRIRKSGVFMYGLGNQSIRTRPFTQKMSNLPTLSTKHTTPLIHVGMDVFGPFSCKDGRKENKC